MKINKCIHKVSVVVSNRNYNEDCKGFFLNYLLVARNTFFFNSTFLKIYVI